MKFKSTALIIIIATAALIGLLNFIINKTTNIDQEIASPTSVSKKEEELPTKKDNHVNSALPHEKRKMAHAAQVEKADPPPSPTEKSPDSADLSEEDIKKITKVAGLSDAELTKELDALKNRIEQEDLFGLLEDEELSLDQEKEAKEVLEKFALLGLEETRRKYMGVEPELKDPIHAHRESLKEIRELLSDD